MGELPGQTVGRGDGWQELCVVLADLLPASPVRLLLLGDTGQAGMHALRAAGHIVSTSTYCDREGALVQIPCITRQAIRQVHLSLSDAYYVADVVVAFDFGPDIHPLALFDQLAVCVAPGGMVVLLGKRPHDVPRMQRWQEYVACIAERCGFEVLQQADNFRYDEEVLGMFRKTASSPRWQLRHVRSEDFPGIAALFQEVFGHAMSWELWQWKYANGRGNAVSASHHGTVIAHYGGIYRDVLLCGQPEWVFQICDVMVHPKERGVMTRKGPFFLTAATSAEIYGPLGFGFPNARAMAVAEKMGLYSEVGQMAEVRWQPNSSRTRLRTQVRVLAINEESKSLVDALWKEMANDLRHGVVGVRDWSYIQYRYLQHPQNRYDVFLVRSRLSRRPIGVMILHRLEAACELMDIIAPLRNLPRLLDQARRLTAHWKLPYLYCWISRNHLERFTDCAGAEAPLNVSIPTSCWTGESRAQVFKDRWWLMSGDTDFR